MTAPPPAPERRARWLAWAGLSALLGLVVYGIVSWAGGSAGGVPAPGPARSSVPAAPPAEPVGAAPAAAVVDRATPDAPERTPAYAPSRCLQGLRGIVHDQANRPLAGVSVHLVEAAGNEPLLLPMMQQQQHFLAPVATTESASDGTFELGLERAQDKLYEVFVVSERHAVLRLTGLRILPGTWHDLGIVPLDEGAVLRGRVTVEGRPDIPVPQAVVAVDTGGAFADAALRALPAGQGELVAHVDAAGFYELRRAPSRGVVRIAAVAPGFAQVERRDVEVAAGATVQVDFELPPGLSLQGEVVDPEGKGLAGARVEAWPDKQPAPPLVAFTDDRGRFTVLGLRAGTHRVRAQAIGYEALQSTGVEAGTEVRLALQRRARIEVLARAPNGALLRNYRLALRRFFAADPDAPLDAASLRTGRIGAVPEVRDQHVRLDGATERATIDGVPTGWFVCEVEAEGFAKTLSPPVHCGAGEPSPQFVEVVVSAGAELLGRVVDEAGRPLAGASVTTLGAGAMPDNPLFRMLDGAVPSRATRRTTTTDADGRFRLDRLALADYLLQVEHPAACRTFVRDLAMQEAIVRTLPPIRLVAGAVVEGAARLGGRVQGQVKVVLTTPPDAPADAAVRFETVTDAEGRFRFERRVPPGTYELRAASVGSAAPEAEIFHQLLQMQRSATTVLVPPGVAVVVHDLELPSAN